MIWPASRIADPSVCPVPAGYLLRSFRAGDEEPYIHLMQLAGFDTWNRDNLDAVLDKAVPDGIIFTEHVASADIVATAMGWYNPSARFPKAHEMGWVAADPAHRERGLGRAVTNAATRALLDQGATRIYLLTDDWRLPAIKTYLNVGYVPLCDRPDLHTRWQKVFTALGLDSVEFERHDNT